MSDIFENWAFADMVNYVKQRAPDIEMGSVSDGFHTFDELYQHRSMLFVVVCNLLVELGSIMRPWKSRIHHDLSQFEGYFIAGFELEKEQITYHLKNEYWDKLDVQEWDSAPKWDGHTSQDVLERLERWFC